MFIHARILPVYSFEFWKFIGMLWCWVLCAFNGDLCNCITLSLDSHWMNWREGKRLTDPKKKSTNKYAHAHTHTDIWQKECCIWHIIASRSLLAAKSLQPNRIKTYFPLQKTVEHLDGSNLALLIANVSSQVFPLHKHFPNVWTSIWMVIFVFLSSRKFPFTTIHLLFISSQF